MVVVGDQPVWRSEAPFFGGRPRRRGGGARMGGFTRYSRDQSFSVLGRNRIFVLVMAIGSIVGSYLGGLLLGVVPSAILLPILAAILVISAVKVWQHE
jgi:hypothetical protein